MNPRCFRPAPYLLGAGLAAFAAADTASANPAGWFPFQPANDPAPGVIGMADWLERPAGARGPVRMEGSGFVLGDGTPIKFWGVNLGSRDCLPEAADGVRWAERAAKYGINCVRLHKFYPYLSASESSVRLDEAMAERLDRFTAELAARGIFYGLSWLFEHRIRPEDRAHLEAYDEIMAAGGDTHRVFVFIAEDVQDLRMEMLRQLLTRRNVHTGKTYAEDPALAFVEFQNEDSIFFYTFRGFDDLPEDSHYRRRFEERFAAYLKDKYGDHDGLVRAWGEQAMHAFGEDGRLEEGRIRIQPNPWYFSPEGMQQARAAGTQRRLLDTAAFLYEVQRDFYRRMEAVVREAGYEGPLVASCWTTPAGVPSYLNLHTDYEIGIIDRHNYFGGLSGWRPRPDRFDARSQLAAPGSGLLSSSLLQVIDRPFAFSEWNTVFPNAWAPEALTIVAAYGMGLQGWDASYHFASHIQPEGFSRKLDDPRLWNIDVPNQVGIYPAIARMVLRGDVAEGEVIGVRRVSIGELLEGGPEWIGRERAEVSEGLGDFKEIRGVSPPEALAAGRMVVEFVDHPAESIHPDIAPFADGRVIRSVTGELEWTVLDDERGWIRIDTAGTQAAVGFHTGEPVELTDAVITPAEQFAAIYLTSLDRERGLEAADEALLTVMARVRNTGMRFNEAEDELLELGGAPMLLEPVRAEFAWKGRRIAAVERLDHDGLPTGAFLEVEDGRSFRIDGARDRTPYYRIRFE
ncbi:MAG: hypothetical protein EA425_16895 [Puniceicoccaceae bacterium]|nr:MAG: hypothetical protein EA425_16895 [Puniceicoccaceae bacterium]